MEGRKRAAHRKQEEALAGRREGATEWSGTEGGRRGAIDCGLLQSISIVRIVPRPATAQELIVKMGNTIITQFHPTFVVDHMQHY